MYKNRIISLLLCLCLIISISSLSTQAVTSPDNQPKYTYFDGLNASITIGTISTTVFGQVTGVSSVKKVTIKLELQKLSDGVYSTIKSWEETFNARNASKTESKLTSPLSTYRLKATFTVYTSSSSETKTLYAYDS